MWRLSEVTSWMKQKVQNNELYATDWTNSPANVWARLSLLNCRGTWPALNLSCWQESCSIFISTCTWGSQTWTLPLGALQIFDLFGFFLFRFHPERVCNRRSKVKGSLKLEDFFLHTRTYIYVETYIRIYMSHLVRFHFPLNSSCLSMVYFSHTPHTQINFSKPKSAPRMTGGSALSRRVASTFLFILQANLTVSAVEWTLRNSRSWCSHNNLLISNWCCRGFLPERPAHLFLPKHRRHCGCGVCWQ